jgi:hypothetical protein
MGSWAALAGQARQLPVNGCCLNSTSAASSASGDTLNSSLRHGLPLGASQLTFAADIQAWADIAAGVAGPERPGAAHR